MFVCMVEFLQLLFFLRGDDPGLIVTYNYFYVVLFDKILISFWVFCDCYCLFSTHVNKEIDKKDLSRPVLIWKAFMGAILIIAQFYLVIHKDYFLKT